MVTVRDNENSPQIGIEFLKHCYRFVNDEWQHTMREDLPDQGFESAFRASCAMRLRDWEISQHREMEMGYGIQSASGVFHEIDVVAKHPELTAIVELKNRRSIPPDKNDVINLFAKIMDYLALNPFLLLKELCPVLLSNSLIDQGAMAACLGLGIHPVCPGIRPMPILIDNAKRIFNEIKRGIRIEDEIFGKFEDFCANLNYISIQLAPTWFSSRCGYLSEDTIVLKAVRGVDSQGLVGLVRRMNSECTWLIDAIKRARA